MTVIGPDKRRQHVSIKTIALGLTHAEAVSGPIKRLRIDRVHHHPMVQKKLHDSSLWLFDGRPKLDPFGPILIKPAAEFAQSLDGFHHPFLENFLPLSVTHPDLMKLIRPIHSQIVPFQLLYLLVCLLVISKALNGKFALYRSSTKGQLSMELHFRSLAGRDSLPLILLAEWDKGGPHTSKLLNSTVTNYPIYSPPPNIRMKEEA